MKAILSAFNALITANSFNPSVFRETWLVAKGFLLDSDLLPGFVFSDQVAHVQSQRFGLLVVPQQLQFVPGNRASARQLVTDMLARLVRELPHTPFLGVGVNFVWHLQPDGESMAEATRRLFAANAVSAIFQEFGASDAHFGAYMSKDIGGARLRLTINPKRVKMSVANQPPSMHDMIECSFNFHRDAEGDNAVHTIAGHLERWAEYDETSERFARIIAEQQ
jgi:hypothetical protein